MVKGNFNLACDDWQKSQKIGCQNRDTTELLEKYCETEKLTLEELNL